MSVCVCVCVCEVVTVKLLVMPVSELPRPSSELTPLRHEYRT